MKPRTVTFTKDSINDLLSEYTYIREALEDHDSVMEMFGTYKDKHHYKRIVRSMLKTLTPEPKIKVRVTVEGGKIKNIEVTTVQARYSNCLNVDSITVTVRGLMAIYIQHYKAYGRGDIKLEMTMDFIDNEEEDSPYFENKNNNLIV